MEIVVRIRTPDGWTRPLHVAVSGTGAASAVVGALDVAFTLSPVPTAGEDIWISR